MVASIIPSLIALATMFSASTAKAERGETDGVYQRQKWTKKRTLSTLQVELLANIIEANSGVRDADTAQTGLDDVVSHSLNQVVVLVSLKHVGISIDGLLESLKVSNSNRLGDLKVGLKGGNNSLGSEKRTLGDVTHKQLNQNRQLRSLVVGNMSGRSSRLSTRSRKVKTHG
jgi:hypothetical protein